MTDVLAIETSSEACSVALAFDGQVHSRFVHAPLKHAEHLLPMVQDVLKEAACRLDQLDAIGFGRGPGSFTSLRIGIGVVQGLAWGAELPVVPISSLAAVAQQVLAEKSAESAGLPILAAMDARMNEVYWALYQADGSGAVRPLGDERVDPPEVVAELVADKVANGQFEVTASEFLAAGNGFERFPELKPLVQAKGIASAVEWPRASEVLQLSQQWLQHKPGLPAVQAQPVYVRDNVARKPGKS